MVEVERIRTRLRRVDGTNPSLVREGVLQVLLDEFGAKFGGFLKIVYRDGVGHWTAITPVGDSEAGQKLRAAEGTRHLSGGLWNPWEPRPAEKDTFTSFDHGPLTREQVFPSDVYRRFYEPFGIYDHARAMMYDGRRFIGWVGLLRTAARPFTLAEIVALNALADDVAAPLIAAENMDGVWSGHHLYFVLNPESLVVEFASARARGWLTARRTEMLQSYLRAFRRGEAAASVLVDGFDVQAVELVGDSGTRYHLNVTANDLPSLGPDALLTPRQREVAELVVAGATTREIGEYLDIATGTAKQHVKDIYDRLEVTSRLELLTLLADTKNPRFAFV